MRIVVAGSSGLIGTALVAELRAAGHEVLRLVRRTAAAPDEREWHPERHELAADALAGADAVVNLCGTGLGARRWTARRKAELRSSRVEPTATLAEAVAAQGIPRLVNASAVGYYGDTGPGIVDETTPAGGGFLADLVRDWEAATRPAVAAGARVVLARSGIVLAPSGGMLGPLRKVFGLALGGRLGSGRQYLSWISLPDEVAGLRYLVEHDDLSGPVNLCTAAPVTNREFTKALGVALGRPTPWVVPGVALKLVFGELAEEGLLTGQRVAPRVLEQHGYRFQHPALDTALNAVLHG